MGGAVSKDGMRIYVGAPGSWYWQGQIFSLSVDDAGSVYKTGENETDDENLYLGYSVTTGEFDGDSDNADIAVGMPRGAGLSGKVVIYNKNLINTHKLNGDQVRL